MIIKIYFQKQKINIPFNFKIQEKQNISNICPMLILDVARIHSSNKDRTQECLSQLIVQSSLLLIKSSLSKYMLAGVYHTLEFFPINAKRSGVTQH